jgi:hypothetical protein
MLAILKPILNLFIKAFARRVNKITSSAQIITSGSTAISLIFPSSKAVKEIYLEFPIW